MHQNQSKTKILLSAASMVVSLAAPVVAGAQEAAQATAAAQTQHQPEDSLQEVIVTGTSIRGVAPVGSDLISLSRTDIEQTGVQTLQQMLKSIPSVTGLQSVGQGAYGVNDSTGANAPTIHGLGGSFSNSTLVLIDGHRFPLAGASGDIADPNMVPANAIERVEVLPDGASSIYGSDAVAGVVNFVTRRHFSGVEANAQTGFGDHYRTYNAGLAMGKLWDGGSVFFAYNFSDRKAVSQEDRPFTFPNHIAQGGTNFANYNCGPASVQPSGGLVYPYPYAAGTGVTRNTDNAFCDQVQAIDLIPAERRNNVMVKIEQEVNERLTLSSDLAYSNRIDHQRLSRGSLTALVYGPGSGMGDQINPFYVAPVGSTATSETVRMSFDDLLGPGAYARASAESYFGTGRAEYKLGGDWLLTGSLMIGANTSTTARFNVLCPSCAILALNGTTDSNGDITTPSIVNTTTTVLNLPLTTANALDPFNPAASNRTSAAVRAGLIDPESYESARTTVQQYDVKVDGTLFHLPAGELRVAAGLEDLRYETDPTTVESLNIGLITSGAQVSSSLKYRREVESGYVEALIPLISAEMRIPLVRTLDIDPSGRYDHYSDFGSTTNPKLGVNWEVVSGLRLRANVARSFVAPPLSAIGQNGVSSADSLSSDLGPFSVPLDRFPQARVIPGCTSPTATVCTFNGSGVEGMIIDGGNNKLKAQQGKTWSVGADLAPEFAPGLTSSLSFWHNELIGGVNAPQPSLAVNSTGFASLLTIYPNGATPAEIDAARAGRPIISVLPQKVYWIYDFRGENALNLKVEGIDADVHYRRDFGWGSARGGAAVAYLTRFDQRIGDGPTFSVLNREGFNSTFPTLQTQVRADFGVNVGHASATVYLNHTGSFTYWGGTAVNDVVTSGGVPVGGGDKVRAYDTVDLHLSYDFAGGLPGSMQAGSTQVFVDVTNLFDRTPPFENATVGGVNSASISGYDPFSGSPIGRVVTAGVRTKF
ncbi:MAG TPA: TonB-dependent receptor [Steroidobacteraceae bacterium]|nr:TonB-dependent receptor [Steroidobacteraceae bacterium]